VVLAFDGEHVDLRRARVVLLDGDEAPHLAREQGDRSGSNAQTVDELAVRLREPEPLWQAGERALAGRAVLGLELANERCFDDWTRPPRHSLVAASLQQRRLGCPAGARLVLSRCQLRRQPEREGLGFGVELHAIAQSVEPATTRRRPRLRGARPGEPETPERPGGTRAMPISGPLAHIDISVGYPEKSIPFYAALLEGLGYRRWTIDSEEWREPNPTRATWGVRCGDELRFAIELRPARESSRDRRYDRYEPGPHHLAFHADGPDTVKYVHSALVSLGADVLDAPSDFSDEPGYAKGYYAAFFSDPDGMKVEVAHIPSANR
jgi:glyoxylase I family protein